MKFPFFNDTSHVIKRLAKRSIAADKRRNLFIILTIAFATALLTALSFYAFAQNRSVIERVRGQYQALAINLTQEKIDQLITQPEVEQYGLSFDFGSCRYEDSILSVNYEDENWVKLNGREYRGTLPETEHEIWVERAFLEYFKLPQKTGQLIRLDLGGGPADYTVTGVIEKENPSRVFEAVVSRDYLAARADGEPLFDFRMRYLGGDQKDLERLKQLIADFFMKNGIDQNEIFYSSNYFDMAAFTSGATSYVVPVSLLILVACSLVIYSIFYISVAGKMREYGRLKVLGTTPRQLRHIVRREGFYLSLRGIPLGLIAGSLIGWLSNPAYWDWSENAKLILIIIAGMEAAILLSTRKPISLAAKVSPIEALRTTAYSAENGKRRLEGAVTRQLARQITPYSLARMNFNRSRRKTVFTMLSLGLTGVMLMLASSLLGSLSPVDMAAGSMGDGADYSISWQDSVNMESAMDMALENPLSEELWERLHKLDFTEDITSYSAITAEIALPRNADPFWILALEKGQMDALLPPEALSEGTADYDALVKGNGIIITDASDHLLNTYWDYKPKIGDVLHLKAYGGTDLDVTVMGIAKGDAMPATGVGGALLTLPKALAKKMYPDTGNLEICWNLHTSEDDDAVRQAVFKTADNPVLMISPKTDMELLFESTLKKLSGAVYLFLIFLFVFAVINLVNTLMTNLLSRQQEFGVLQSVGLTGKQLSRMLSMECFWYVAATLIISLTAGSALSVLMVRIMNQFKLFETMAFHFPFVPFLAFTAALLLLAVLYSVFAVGYMRKRSLVDRIKLMD